MDDLIDILRRLKDECVKSVEYGDWPELQDLVEEAEDVLGLYS